MKTLIVILISGVFATPVFAEEGGLGEKRENLSCPVKATGVAPPARTEEATDSAAPAPAATTVPAK